MSALHALGVRDAAARIRRRELSSVELVRAALAAHRRRRPQVGAFLIVERAEALAAAEAIDRRVAPATTPGRSPACPSAQGHLLHRGRPHHRRLADPRALRPALRRHRRRRACKRAGAVLLGKLNWTSSPWARRTRTPPSARRATRGTATACPAARRAARRGRRGGPGARGARHRHRRLDPPAGGVLRRRRAQADLRPRVALRRGRLRLVARPGRAARARRRRRGARPRGDRGPRPARLDRLAAPGAGLRRRARRATCAASASACPASTSPRASSPRSTRPSARRSRELERLGAVVERLAAAHRVRDRHLLPHRDRRGVVEPRALRRRALRPARRRAARQPRRDVRADARRRLRRRGEAPHHARHLRAVRRLLRRVLPEGAAGPDADPARLRAGVRAAAT